MPLPESSLSVVCTSVSFFVRTGLNAAANNINISLGAPADMVKNADHHQVNLFFYRFEPFGFDSDSHPNDPWRLRLFCLISVVGIDEDDIPAGENDLRLLGEIMRIFRERPVLNAVSVGGEQVRLQCIFSPISDEQINQVWSTQGDTTYRPSIIYEMALAPIMPSQHRIPAPLVGAIGNEANALMSQRFNRYSSTAHAPRVPFYQVNTDDPQWVPHIAWIYQNECEQSLSFDIDSAEFAAFAAQIWIAGDPAKTVNLVWEIWDGENGWRSAGAVVVAVPYSNTIDPNNIPASIPATFPFPVAPPVTIPAGANAAQGVLYAARSFTPYTGAAAIEIRSNPLLLNIYRVA